jgi:hypothetical protein
MFFRREIQIPIENIFCRHDFQKIKDDYAEILAKVESGVSYFDITKTDNISRLFF